MSRPIDLTIGRLILDGIAVGDRKRLKATIERELARLLEAAEVRPALIAGGPPALVDGGTLWIKYGDGDGPLAAAIARAIHATLAVPSPVPAAAPRPLPPAGEGRGEGTTAAGREPT